MCLFERDLPMSEYALVWRPMLRRRFGFDVVNVIGGELKALGEAHGMKAASPVFR